MPSEANDHQAQACCAPSRKAPGEPSAKFRSDGASAGPVAATIGATPVLDLVDLDAGTFTMGTDEEARWPADGEGPAREVTLSAYRIAKHAVTNAEFERFVSQTDWTTDAERFGWSFVFGGFLPDDFPETRGVVGSEWWRQVFGANWRHPAGPQSDLDGLSSHPVVHVSWNDAIAYCRWAGAELPTEAQWEHAARGGLHQQRYPWGNTFAPDGNTMCNIFEGTFPSENTGADGFLSTAPVDAFAPNGFGLHNVSGNVWEWCHDWFSPDHHADPESPTRTDPTGPTQGEQRVMRGGSHLCHDSYCDRYRVSARSSSAPDSSTGNLGFRIAQRSAH